LVAASDDHLQQLRIRQAHRPKFLPQTAQDLPLGGVSNYLHIRGVERCKIVS
jgi:hypothetical protein